MEKGRNRVLCLLLLCGIATAAVPNRDTISVDQTVDAFKIENTPIALASFTFSTTPPPPGKGVKSTITNLLVCAKDDLFSDANETTTTHYTLVYSATSGGSGVETNLDGKIENDAMCATFTTSDKELPTGKMRYELRVLQIETNSEDKHVQIGHATFEFDETTYENEGVYIDCGSASYKRYTVAAGGTCGDDQQIDDGDNDVICYKIADANPDDDDNCKPVVDATGDDDISVCLPDLWTATVAKPNVEDDVAVSSLAYPADDSSPAVLTLDDGATSTEVIMRTNDTFRVGKCENSKCDVIGYEQSTEVYEVCGVVTTDLQDAKVSAAPTTITDLNVLSYVSKEKDVNVLEFGFHIAAENVPKFYYATVTGGQKGDGRSVGISCNGVDDDSACYGFLDVTDFSTGELKIEFSDDKGSSPSDTLMNVIIAHFSTA